MALIPSSFLYYILFVFLALLLFAYVYIKRAMTYWEKLGVPCKQNSVIKTFIDLLYERRSITDLFRELYAYHKQKGDKYCGLYTAHIPLFIPFDKELIKNILIKDFEHFHDRVAMFNEEHDPLTANLLFLRGAKWKYLRQKLTPAFTSGKLKKMISIIVESTEKMVECMDEKVDKTEPIDMNNMLVKFTTDVIGSCAFGIECNSFKDPDSEFVKYGRMFFHPSYVDYLRQMFVFVFPEFSKKIKLMVTNKGVDRFYRKLVRDTVEYREKNNIHRNDFLQLLIQLKNQGNLDETGEEDETKLTIDDIAAQVYIFFLGGYETSSTCMTFSIYELAKNKEVQDKAREEIVRVLKKYDGEVTYEAIMEMQYMERVISETLRMHTPVPMLQRIVTKDYQVPDSDLVLKKGLIIFVPTCCLHENPEYYPEPEKFDPDRFTEENKTSRPDFTYIPFAEGPRFCIGMRFAMLEMKVCLVQLLLKYKFSLDSKTIDPIILSNESFFPTIKGGLWINAERI